MAALGTAERSLSDTPERAEELSDRVPLHVALSAEDHAWSYVFLASNRARGITGGVIHTDGGMSVSGAPKKRS
jgi:phthalate 3,4-cis-dihydrodiol dehydrogenase